MLRAIVLVLVLANLLLLAWSRDWLGLGERPTAGREPQRLQQQIRPEALRLLAPGAETAPDRRSGAPAPAPASASTPASTAASAPASAPPPAQTPATPPSTAPSPARAPAPATAAPAGTSAAAQGGDAVACLEAGPFAPAQAAQVETVLRRAFPPHTGLTWVVERQEVPATWMVYMGRYPDAATRQGKEAELRTLRVPFEVVEDLPLLDPGLSLGRHASREEAESALRILAERGVRTARVVEATPAGGRFDFRFTALEAGQAETLRSLTPELFGRPFLPCQAD